MLTDMYSTLPDAGCPKYNGTAVTAGQFVSAADIAAGKLVFTPAANANGSPYASFTFQVQDDGGTANGGVDLDPTPNTLTINVTIDLYADLGPSGLWDWNGAGWLRLTTVNPEGMVVAPRGDLYADLGRYGLWRWTPAAGWLKLTTANPEGLAVTASGDLYADLGRHGLWRWTPAAGWLKLTT